MRKMPWKKGDLFTSGGEHGRSGNRGGLFSRACLRSFDPIIILIVFCVIGLIYVGGYFSGVSFVDAFADTDATVGLPWGSLVALVITIVYMLCRRLITFKEAMACIPKGFIAMVPAILILTFATSLKNTTVLLGSAEFVAGLMEGAAAGLTSFLPAVIFCRCLFPLVLDGYLLGHFSAF